MSSKKEEGFIEKIVNSAAKSLARIGLFILIMSLFIAGYRIYYLLFNNMLSTREKKNIYIYLAIVIFIAFWAEILSLYMAGMFLLGFLFMRFIFRYYHIWGFQEYMTNKLSVNNAEDASWAYGFFLTTITILLFIISIILWTILGYDWILNPVGSILCYAFIGIGISFIKND